MGEGERHAGAVADATQGEGGVRVLCEESPLNVCHWMGNRSLLTTTSAPTATALAACAAAACGPEKREC